VASPLTLQPDGAAGKDALIYSDAATTNYGTNVDCYLGDVSASASHALRILIAFDVSGVPAGATVNSATLSLWEFAAGVAGGGPASWAANVHRVLVNWVEAQATWNILSTGNNWGTAGCSNATDRSATPSAILTLDGAAAAGFVSWSGAGLVADVQAWVDGTATNYGWLLTAPGAEFLGTTPLAYNQFYLSDYTTDAAKRPKLVIAYTEAGGGGTVPLMTDHYSRMRRG
jgi:Disaggregatase related repeat